MKLRCNAKVYRCSKQISDIGKYQFVGSTKRGGTSIICRGHSETNNKFLKSYDPSNPSKNIMYLDANNLYEHSMMQLLPTEIFDWVIPKNFNPDNFYDDGSIGSFLELDRDYFDELHYLHSD